MFHFDLGEYKWSALMPLIGAGFYVAPRSDGGSAQTYRIGYGVHNTYLFPFEQGGIVAFIAFLIFLYGLLFRLNRVRKVGRGSDQLLAIAALAYMLASLPAYLAGQIFWVGFGTGHFNTFLLIVLLSAVRRTRMLSVLSHRPVPIEASTLLHRHIEPSSVQAI
jgi:hypothetical protein